MTYEERTHAALQQTEGATNEGYIWYLTAKAVVFALLAIAAAISSLHREYSSLHREY